MAVFSLVVLGLIPWQFSPGEGVWWEDGHLVFYFSDAVGQAMWSTHPKLHDYFGSDELMVHDTLFSIAGTTLFGYFLAAVAVVTCAPVFLEVESKGPMIDTVRAVNVH